MSNISSTNSSNVGTKSSSGIGSETDSASDQSSDITTQTTTERLSSAPTTTEALAAEPTTFDTLSGQHCEVPGVNGSDAEVDSFHACTSGVDDKEAIDRAQELTQDGGCAAISEDAMLCNPTGPEIGEFTVGRPPEFPDYIGPNSDYSHTYQSVASTPGNWSSLKVELDERIQQTPTPGNNQTTATPAGVVNDAGITFVRNTDLVRSSVSTDVQGRQVVSNVTIPGRHILNPGVVSQTAWSDEQGTHAIAVGEGNGALSIPANPVAREVFENKLEADLRSAIFRDTTR